VSDQSDGPLDSIARLPQRIASLVELVTNLDQRVIAALDSIEAMQRSVGTFEPVAGEADELIADLRRRIAATDARVNRDMDEIKGVLLAKLGELDLGELSSRIDRLEKAILNIEQATVNLDKAFEGGLELLPDFMTRKLKGEGRKKAPKATTERPTKGL
jgi:hypothetical protein